MKRRIVPFIAFPLPITPVFPLFLCRPPVPSPGRGPSAGGSGHPGHGIQGGVGMGNAPPRMGMPSHAFRCVGGGGVGMGKYGVVRGAVPLLFSCFCCCSHAVLLLLLLLCRAAAALVPCCCSHAVLLLLSCCAAAALMPCCSALMLCFCCSHAVLLLRFHAVFGCCSHAVLLLQRAESMLTALNAPPRMGMPSHAFRRMGGGGAGMGKYGVVRGSLLSWRATCSL